MKIIQIILSLLLSASLCPAVEEWESQANQGDKYLYVENDLAKAVDAYSRAIALKPQNPGLFANRGNAFSYMNKLDKAMADYDKAIALAVEQLGSAEAPELCFIYYNKAYAYDRAGRHSDAIPYYEKVIAINTSYPDAHGNLAWILATSHEPSLRNAQKAVDLATHELAARGGKSAAIMDTLAAAHAASGNFEEAVSWQQKAIGLAESESDKKEFTERLSLYQRNEAFFQTK